MNKVLFINLEGEISIPLIVESQTFEPEFKVYSDDMKLENDEQIIVFYEKEACLKTIRDIRYKLGYKNRRFILVFDHSSFTKQELMTAGADACLEKSQLKEKIVDYLTKYKEEISFAAKYNETAFHPFQMAVLEIFNMMAFMNVEIEEVYRAKSMFHYSNLTASMALSGKQKGNIAVTMEQNLAKKIVANFLAYDPEALSLSEICDGIGEVVNMIAGGAKARISAEEELFDLSAPIVVTGDYLIHSQKDVPNVNLVLRFEEEYFVVRIGLLSLGK